MIAVFLLGIAAILGLYSFYYRRKWYRALLVQVFFSRPHVCAGESFELAEIIENRKKLALPVLEIGFRLPRGLQFEDADNTQESDFIYKRDLFAVAGMERIVRRYRMTAARRGIYTVSQITFNTPSRLFGSTYMMDRTAQEDSAPLYVYPANVNCGLLLRAVEVILGERESARRLYEDPFAFASIRSYTIQDPMNTINWKATARTGSLMVNTYTSTTAVRIRIFLDVGTDPGNPFSDSLRELGISMAASLIRNLVKGQLDASLLVNCHAPGGESRDTFVSSSGGDEPRNARFRRSVPAEGGFLPGLLCQGERHGFTFFPSCQSPGRLTGVEEFLAGGIDEAQALPFDHMIRLEADGHGVVSTPGGGDEVLIFLTHMDSPRLRSAIHGCLGTGRSGILALMCRTADRRREEHERNLCILPVTE